MYFSSYELVKQVAAQNIKSIEEPTIVQLNLSYRTFET